METVLPGEAIAGGRSVRFQETSETDAGETSSSVMYYDATTGALLGGSTLADGYSSVIGSDGYPTGDIYDPDGNLTTLAGILKMDEWTFDETLLGQWVVANDMSSASAEEQLEGYIQYIFDEATTQFYQEEVEFKTYSRAGELIGW